MYLLRYWRVVPFFVEGVRECFGWCFKELRFVGIAGLLCVVVVWWVLGWEVVFATI